MGHNLRRIIVCIPTKTKQVDRSPAILTSDDFIRSNEILRKKWSIY